MKKHKKMIANAAPIETNVVTNIPIAVSQSDIPDQNNEVVQSTKYPPNVMKVLKVPLGVSSDSTELDNQINLMLKMQALDQYLSSQMYLNGTQIRKGVNDVFGIDLNKMSKNNEGNLSYYDEVMEVVRAELKVDPQSTEQDDKIMSKSKSQVMDIYLHSLNGNITINNIQTVVNGVFGVNLAGISSLEYARFSVYSKGGWVIQKETDLFVVESGKGDIDLYIYPTAYFTEQTGINGLPVEIQEQLQQIGMTYNEESGVMKYHTADGESMTDAFKNEMMRIVSTYTQENFLDL